MFAWVLLGFDIDSQGRIMLRPINKLGGGDWNDHLVLLRRNYSTWRFDEATNLG
ncbi:MAG TPA: hypothetical protein VFF30_08040 [Nitrososphaerales archaeon]|nr:hypothetical protein [Nitrososphaerales archaeon]